MTNFFNDVINRALEYPVDGGPVASVYVSQEKVGQNAFIAGPVRASVQASGREKDVFLGRWKILG